MKDIKPDPMKDAKPDPMKDAKPDMKERDLGNWAVESATLDGMAKPELKNGEIIFADARPDVKQIDAKKDK